MRFASPPDLQGAPRPGRWVTFLRVPRYRLPWLPRIYSDWGGCVSLTSLVLLSVSSSDSSREAPSMCSWRRPDRLAEKLIGPPRLESRESVWARPQQLVAGKSFNHLTTQLQPFLKTHQLGWWADQEQLRAFPPLPHPPAEHHPGRAPEPWGWLDSAPCSVMDTLRKASPAHHGPASPQRVESKCSI